MFFSPTKIFSTVIQAYNLMSGDKILCSLTSILHRAILFWEYDQSYEKSRISERTGRWKHKMGDYKIVTFCLFLGFFCSWQTPNPLFRRSANRAKCVTSTGYGDFEFIQNSVLQNYVRNTLKTLWRRTNNAFLIEWQKSRTDVFFETFH